MRSPYCTKVELRSALERRAVEGIRVIPIIAETCDWEAMPIFKFAALPKDKANNLKPLNKWRSDKDVALTQIAQQIRRNIEQLTNIKEVESQYSKADDTGEPEELGYFDYIDIFDDAKENMLYVLKDISETTQSLIFGLRRTNNDAIEVNKLRDGHGKISSKLAKELASRAAADMELFSGRTEESAKEFLNVCEAVKKAALGIILTSDDQDGNVTRVSDIDADFKNIHHLLAEVVDTIRGAKDGINSLPPMTKDFIKARRKAVHKLEVLSGEFERAANIFENLLADKRI
jgi:hypothetical protein